MKIHDLQILHNIPFEEYLSLPGISYSTIKSEGKGFAPTSKMRLGTDVHSYISDPSGCSNDINIPLVKPIANLIITEIGSLYKIVEKEVVVTCLMEFGGFIMKYKGRIDLKVKNLLIIDLKVAEDVEKTIYYFGYDHQIEGYCIPLGIPQGIIIGVSPKKVDPKTKLNQVKRIAVRVKYSWWEQKVAQWGRKIDLERFNYAK